MLTFCSPSFWYSALCPIPTLYPSVVNVVPASSPIRTLFIPVVKEVAVLFPNITLSEAAASIDVPAPVPNTILSSSNLNAKNEPDTVNEPVITASPVNGNGSVDMPVNCEPSPWNEPEKLGADAVL